MQTAPQPVSSDRRKIFDNERARDAAGDDETSFN